MGYKTKMDTSSIFGTNQKFIEEEIKRKTEEYHNKVEITMISQICESAEIKFNMEVLAGLSPNMIAANAVKRLGATWIILDRSVSHQKIKFKRKMKKDKQFFMENLTCGISRMKRNGSVEKLRGPKPIDNSKPIPEKRNKSIPRNRIKEHAKYDEMIRRSPNEELCPKKIPSPPYINIGKKQDGGELTYQLTTSSLGTTKTLPPILAGHFEEDEVTKNTGRAKTEVLPSIASFSSKQHIYKNDWIEEFQADEVFENSTCTLCNNQRPKIGWKRDFTYAELQAATDGFFTKNFLSDNEFGSIYKGELNGVRIAVKQHKNASFQGEKEFKSEVHVLSKARHENLVMMIGSCSEGGQRLLVYEYVCYGSLDQHLSTHNTRPLSWEKKIKIATGAAKGLKYLHENNIIHRDVRPKNILITHDYESLLGDFGLTRTNQHEDLDQSGNITIDVGSLGYLAPEYGRKMSTKIDVYAFGVILLQLITGIRPTDKKLGGKSLVGWVSSRFHIAARPLLKERNYPDLMDPRNADAHDVHQLYWMVRIAEKCLTRDPHKRLTMDTVVSALDNLNQPN
ncbi:hypothetical protein ACLB2K_047331 [Fragaria x ananassa]